MDSSRLMIWLFALAAAAGAAVLFWADPMRVAFYPRCTLHALTGLYCPGCGSLRALHQLLHGQVAAAWRLNPLALVLLPFAGGLALRRAVYHLGWTRTPGRLLPPVLMWGVLIAVLLFGILRNLPWAPFTALAPHG